MGKEVVVEDGGAVERVEEDEDEGIPPVAWAAARSAEMEDIGSEELGGISSPAARAASRREEDEGGAAAVETFPPESKSRSNDSVSRLLLLPFLRPPTCNG